MNSNYFQKGVCWRQCFKEPPAPNPRGLPKGPPFPLLSPSLRAPPSERPRCVLLLSGLSMKSRLSGNSLQLQWTNLDSRCSKSWVLGTLSFVVLFIVFFFLNSVLCSVLYFILVSYWVWMLFGGLLASFGQTKGPCHGLLVAANRQKMNSHNDFARSRNLEVNQVLSSRNHLRAFRPFKEKFSFFQALSRPKVRSLKRSTL